MISVFGTVAAFHLRQYSLISLIPPPWWPSGKASASRAVDLGLIPHLHCGSFSWSSHTSDFKMGTTVDCLVSRLALQGQRWNLLVQCQYTVTWWDSLNCSVYLSVAAALSLRYIIMLLGRYLTNEQPSNPPDHSVHHLSCCWDVKQSTNNPLTHQITLFTIYHVVGTLGNQQTTL